MINITSVIFAFPGLFVVPKIGSGDLVTYDILFQFRPHAESNFKMAVTQSSKMGVRDFMDSASRGEQLPSTK